jgi:uncharacterized membrane protein (DUF2068 family)
MIENAKTSAPKRRAPTLYLIIVGKLIKGILALALAFGVLKLAGKDLPELFARLLNWIHLDPENHFLSDIADKLETITAANVRVVALGTFLYSAISLVEGVGLIYRVSWAGWLAIGESAFFIPIEMGELVHHPNLYIVGVLAFNVLIVWYLYANRVRLFRHHH